MWPLKKKKPAPPPPPPPPSRYVPETAKGMLALLDQFFLTRHRTTNPVEDRSETEKLWDVLTALRGPDSGSYIEKDTTTVHIRRAAFPHTAMGQLKGYVYIPAVMNPDHPADGNPYTGDKHFNAHYMAARRQLERMGLWADFIEAPEE